MSMETVPTCFSIKEYQKMNDYDSLLNSSIYIFLNYIFQNKIVFELYFKKLDKNVIILFLVIMYLL